jgi:L-ascorbate metabolism protein UlaG (beta-lactamase superfamily)
MYIKKLGHCCLLIKEKALTILTDPGMFTTDQNELSGIDVILITHEHSDHFHVESVKKVLANNPRAKIITNHSVGKLLDKEQIPYTIVAHGNSLIIDSVVVEGFGEKHAQIYSEIPVVENTGYFINNRLFYPGDALYNPERPVDILALPVAGPWIKISEAIEYGLVVKPNHAFPVHDALLTEKALGIFHRHPQKFLGEAGIEFHALTAGQEIEL